MKLTIDNSILSYWDLINIKYAASDIVQGFATFGMQANFAVYLMKVYNMDQVFAANIINTWYAVSFVLPLIGAFVADAYLGKFRTIAIASFASLTVKFQFFCLR